MKRMKKILLALLVMALLLITACGSGSEKSASATEAVYDKVEYPAEEEWEARIILLLWNSLQRYLEAL